LSSLFLYAGSSLPRYEPENFGTNSRSKNAPNPRRPAIRSRTLTKSGKAEEILGDVMERNKVIYGFKKMLEKESPLSVPTKT